MGITIDSLNNSIKINNAYLIKKYDSIQKSIDKQSYEVKEYKKYIESLEKQMAGEHLFNIVFSFIVIGLLVLIIIKLFYKKKKNIKEGDASLLSTSVSKEQYEQILEVLEKIDNRLSQNRVSDKNIDNDVKHKVIEDTKITEKETPNKVEEKTVLGDYLQYDNDGYYIEVYKSDKPTSFYESKYDGKTKISEVSIANNINIKSSAAKSRLTPLFDVEGDYGEAILKIPTKVLWKGKKAELLERGKIKLVD